MTTLVSRFAGILCVISVILTWLMTFVGNVLLSSGQLAYVGAMDGIAYLWILDLTHGISIPLVGDVSINAPFALSPDGQQIAFFRQNANGRRQLGVINQDGSNLRFATLVRNSGLDVRAVWLPNNAEILVNSLFALPQIFNAADLSSRNLPQIERSICGSAALSPNGQRIAGVAGTQNTSGVFNCGLNGIAVMDLESGDNVVSILPDFQSLNPLWSPDNHTIALYGVFGLIIAADTESSTPYQLSTAPLSTASVPVWSPDGTQLAMATRMDGTIDIYVVSVEAGSIPRDLTPFPTVESYPTWSIDGTEIAYVSSDRLISEIYIVNVTTREIRRVTHNNVNELNLVWLP